MNNKMMEYARTAHNRTVYASGAKAPSGSVLARSIASLIPTQKLRHILPALVFAAQSPYPGWQNVVNSRTLCAIVPKICWIIMKKLFEKET
jgi:hypothetical protein